MDIDGIGRIVNFICADFNEDCLNAVASVMHADFVFVSAFSPDTDTMFKTAVSSAERKAITTVLCNSCAAYKASDEDTLNSFIVAPDVKNGRLKSNTVYEGKRCEEQYLCDLCYKCEDIIKR